MLNYADHHIFDSDDLKDIIKQFTKISSAQKILLTTEKDAVRMQKFEAELKEFPFYVLPIEHTFMFDGATAFNQSVVNFINSFKKN